MWLDMDMTTTTTNLTAIRTWHGKQAKITVYCDGVRIATAGGKRAARAEAVIVTAWSHRPEAGIHGLRSDAHVAQVEADRMLEARSVKSSKYGDYTTTPATLAVAVAVTEATA